MLKDTVKKRLGYMVKNEREHLRLSQSALAEQAGVSIRTISDIETCNGNPELATLIPLAQYLKISLDYSRSSTRNRPYYISNSGRTAKLLRRGSSDCSSYFTGITCST